MPINDIVGFDVLDALNGALWRSYGITIATSEHTSMRYEDFFRCWESFLCRWSSDEIRLRRMYYDAQEESVAVLVPDSDDTSLAYYVYMRRIPKSRGGWEDKSTLEWGVAVYDDFPSFGELVFKTRILGKDLEEGDADE